MDSTYIPFRPALHGRFAARFYTKARMVASLEENRCDIETLVAEEVGWVTEECKINPKQRRIYRAAWLLLRDLLRSGWRCRCRNGILELAPTLLDKAPRQIVEMQDAKSTMRKFFAESRRSLIAEARDFIERMENPSPNGLARVPIMSLVADGTQLAKELQQISELSDREIQLSVLRKTIRPYLQLVRENSRDPETGHKLGDIWRYFRFTWATPAESTPGRTLSYLIRDAAHLYHPVIGIASLENAPVRITVRDDSLGWTYEAFCKEITESPTLEYVRSAFERLLGYIKTALGEITFEDLCTTEESHNPTGELIQRLADIAAKSAADRQEALRIWQNRDRSEDAMTIERSDLGNISRAAEDALYRRKRAERLAQLLIAQEGLLDILRDDDFPSRWQQFISSDVGKSVIRTGLIALKNRHIGTSLLELNVCGAIPPYNKLLGGKLVALMVMSPQVIYDYRERYGDRPSDIASRLKGEPVVRPAELVYVGTTSLYHVGSSQYNRLKLPAGLLRDDGGEVRWRKLGETSGYGTFHISRLTLQCLEEISNQDGCTNVNHIFGEGSSPKLRLLNESLAKLFEPGQRQVADRMSRHAMSRLVYGAWLASNGAAYLRDEVQEPQYYFDDCLPPKEATERIVDYWRDRWLLMRIFNTDTINEIAGFDKSVLCVSHDLSGTKVDKFAPIEEGVNVVMSSASADHDLSRDFVRKLYLGSSAYADMIDISLLSTFHVETGLDRAVLEALEGGASVILTGNPGDGKTHLLRMHGDSLSNLPTQPVVELDASAKRDSEFYEAWKDAEVHNRPFCVAINEAVLFSLSEKFSDFRPLQAARHQVEKAIYYDTPPEGDSRVVVFDLSLRNALAKCVVDPIIDKLTGEVHITTCLTCETINDCDFTRNRALLQSVRVRDRLQVVFDRLIRRGYHATVREVQGLISYLLYGGRNCQDLIRTSNDENYSMPQLVYTGKGRLFDAIRTTFDPASVSHPIWDDALIYGETLAEDWINEWTREVEALDPNNFNRFEARKRAFYFCHVKGDELLRLYDDDESKFATFLDLPNREALRFIIKKINRFFGSDSGSDEIQVWQAHRYGQSSRRILFSALARERTKFEIVSPRLSPRMANAFDLVKDHVLLRLRGRNQAKPKIDFSLFQLLTQAERGVPVMSLEVDATRRIWQFMEQLSAADEHIDEVCIALLDPESGEQLSVTVDNVDKRYLRVVGRE